jgi:threonine/homoserine/homoserine lactone efflux protein
MDILTIAGIAMLVLWALGAFVLEAPGVIHLLLTLGVFFLVFGAIKRAERARKS